MMRFGGRIEPLEGDLPHVTYRWDSGTEILSGIAEEIEGERGYTGSIELEDTNGAVITLDLLRGLLRGVEVVVWPPVETVDDLSPPSSPRPGQLSVPSRPSQPGIAVLEVDVTLSARRSSDESVFHLRLGAAEAGECVAVADNLLLEVDGAGELSGLWLSGVPPFTDVSEDH